MFNTVNQEKRSCEEEPTKFLPICFCPARAIFIMIVLPKLSLSMMDKSLRTYTTYLPNQIRRF